jgi:hypothetical protein
VTSNFASKSAIVLLNETFKKIDFRIDFLIILSLSINLSRCQAFATRAKRIQRIDFRIDRLNFFNLNLKFFYFAFIFTSRHWSLQIDKMSHSSLQIDIYYKSKNDFRIIIIKDESRFETKKKKTERKEHAEKSKKKYESRTHIHENKMQEWDELSNDDLWNSFCTGFVEWIDENFKLTSIIIQKKFKAFLQARDVWIMKSLKLIIAKSFAQIIKKYILISWTEKKIRSCLKSKTFVSHVIIHLLKTNFERNSKNYSW